MAIAFPNSFVAPDNQSAWTDLTKRIVVRNNLFLVLCKSTIGLSDFKLLRTLFFKSQELHIHYTWTFSEFSSLEFACDPASQFECGTTGRCIPKDRICDTFNDCGKFEDETSELCGEAGCEVDNGGCEQECVTTVKGHYCACRLGFVPAANGTCEGGCI